MVLENRVTVVFERSLKSGCFFLHKPCNLVSKAKYFSGRENRRPKIRLRSYSMVRSPSLPADSFFEPFFFISMLCRVRENG